MPYMTYRQLKHSAKMRMKPVMGKLIGTAAIWHGLTLTISVLATLPGLLIKPFALSISLYFLFILLGTVFSGMLNAGFHYLCLKLYCGRAVSVRDIFYAFTKQTGTALSLSIMMSVLEVVPMMPAYYFLQRFGGSQSSMDMATALFCYTPALILTTIWKLIYSQIYFFMLDFPFFSAKELFRESRLLMCGHKGRLFYIQVCFLPLILTLGVFTCGIGMLWITPFMYAVKTEFYLDLVTKKGRKQTIYNSLKMSR